MFSMHSGAPPAGTTPVPLPGRQERRSPSHRTNHISTLPPDAATQLRSSPAYNEWLDHVSRILLRLLRVCWADGGAEAAGCGGSQKASSKGQPGAGGGAAAAGARGTPRLDALALLSDPDFLLLARGVDLWSVLYMANKAGAEIEAAYQPR